MPTKRAATKKTTKKRATKSLPAKPANSATPSENGNGAVYDRVLARSHTAIMQSSRACRDISPAPPIRNRKRRKAALKSLLVFLKTYFRKTFSLPFSDDHLAIIARLESAITNGGQYAVAAPRGGGKTSLVERACLWALLSGRRKFVVVVAATEALAESALARIKSECEHNKMLLADFPKAVYPLHRLESQSRRTIGQLFNGERTQIVWQKKRLALPVMPGPDNEASGGIIHVAGLGGAVRGLSHIDPSGATVRPDLVLIDDPQTRESANSVIQTHERLSILNGDLLGLSSPTKKITAIACLTCIQRGDLADTLLDVEKNPSWQGTRFVLVNKWPERADLWQEYVSLRTRGLKPGGDGGAGATAFYRGNRAAMDAGSECSWPRRFIKGELSAIQHAMNLRADIGEDSFQAEYQNTPIEHAAQLDALDPVQVAGRLSGFERFVSPPECERVTAFVDVGERLLWYVVCAWSESFDCYVVDYGCWPPQNLRVFLTRNAGPSLADVYVNKGGVEGVIFAALGDLVDKLARREWRRSDGALIPLSRVLVDSGWLTECIRLFIRQSPHAGILTPSKGMGLGPGATAIADYRQRPGERLGDGWILGSAGPDRLRLLRFDSNHAKSRIAQMLANPMGTRGGITLFGDKPHEHELFALHCCSEYAVPTTAKGNTVNVWAKRPDMDNHMLDGLCGCAVAASLEGLSPLTALGANAKPVGPRKYVSFSAMQRNARYGRGP
jgi:hypothetical protein